MFSHVEKEKAWMDSWIGKIESKDPLRRDFPRAKIEFRKLNARLNSATKLDHERNSIRAA